MVRFGLVGVNTSHADAFAKIFNGAAEQPAQLRGGKIVAVWGDDAEKTDRLAATYAIPSVVGDPAGMIEDIDAVLVVDDNGGGATHAELATPFLAAGLPTFIDKPMTLKYQDAVDLFALARKHDAPLLSCSALRFSEEFKELRETLPAIGALSSVVSVGPGDWYYYGVHAVEQLVAIIGPGASWVQRFAFPQRDVAVIGYESGPAVVVETLRDAKYLFHMTFYGAEGWTQVEISDHAGFYRNTMAEVLRMAQDKRAPLRPEDTLEVLAILTAGVRSAENGARVALADIRGER